MKKLMLFFLFFFLGMGLVACITPDNSAPPAATDVATEEAVSPTELPAPTMEMSPTDEPAPIEEQSAADCPETTDDTYLLRDPRHGFCLLYPATHKVERPNPQEVILVIGGLLNAGDPRAMINVTPSDGRTADDVASEILSEFEGLGIDIARSETTVAGETAVVLNNVPGQDINRRVIFTHDDRLFQIYFSPIDPAAAGPTEAFIDDILTSFTFIPVAETITAADECVAPKADEQLVMSAAFGYCFLIPADFTYEEPSQTNANVFFGSMMDVEHPKLMIEVSDAAGRDAAAAAEELVATFEGFEIVRTFGNTLGYEVAEQLDGVPGQDLGRVLLVAHNDRLYRLTFVPSDPAQTEVYTQMEALFAQVLSTFRFLP